MRLVGLLLLGLQAADEAPGRWDGVPAGSWVIFGSRPIAEPVPRRYATWRLSLADPAPDGRPRLVEDDGPPRPQVRLPVLGTGFRETARRSDERVIGGRPLACTVVEYLGEGGALTVWSTETVRLPGRDVGALPRRAAVPPGVVRIDAVYAEKSGRLKTSLEVVDLSSPLATAGRRLDCAVELETSIYEGPNCRGCLRRWKRWWSEEVPGRLVRQDRQCTADLAAAEGYQSRDEVVDFRLNR